MSPILENKLNAWLKSLSERRVNGKVASSRTQDVDRDVLFAAFRRLHALGYKLEDPENFKEKHVRILVEDWWKRGFKPKTMQNNLSRLRVFFNKMGKSGMVKEGGLAVYLPHVDPELLVVRSAATEGKSWISRGVDVQEVFARIDAKDRRLGLMVRMQLAFGLRQEEVLKCKPHRQDMETWFAVEPGQGKGGRERSIPAFSRQILDEVKSQVGKNEELGWPYTLKGQKASLEQNLKRYQNTMRRLGITKDELEVTGHGLRAQFAENAALSFGVVPPTLGGTKAQLPADELKLRSAKVSEALGHHRPQIVAAYYGAFSREKFVADEFERTVGNIERGLEVLANRDLPPVPQDRFDDCVKIRDVITELRCDLNLRQVHALWAMASEREGIRWKEPVNALAIVLEGAALTILGLDSARRAAAASRLNVGDTAPLFPALDETMA